MRLPFCKVWDVAKAEILVARVMLPTAVCPTANGRLFRGRHLAASFSVGIRRPVAVTTTRILLNVDAADAQL